MVFVTLFNEQYLRYYYCFGAFALDRLLNYYYYYYYINLKTAGNLQIDLYRFYNLAV